MDRKRHGRKAEMFYEDLKGTRTKNQKISKLILGSNKLI